MFLLILIYILLQIVGIHAVSSNVCLSLIQKLQRAIDGGIAKCRPPCGRLDTGDLFRRPVSFMDRLSPSCQAVLSRYSRTSRRAEISQASYGNASRYISTSWPSMGPGAIMSDGGFPRLECSNLHAAAYATNPVVVEVDDAANFAMCTVPKAGCTLFRSILYVLTRRPERSLSFRNGDVHTVDYPTGLFYEHQPALEDKYPTFVLGRNPYIRLVSGMTVCRNHFARLDAPGY